MVVTVARSTAEDLPECLSEPAVRVVSACYDHVVEGHSAADAVERSR